MIKIILKTVLMIFLRTLKIVPRKKFKNKEDKIKR